MIVVFIAELEIAHMTLRSSGAQMMTDNKESLSLTMGPDSCNVKDKVVYSVPQNGKAQKALS